LNDLLKTDQTGAVDRNS